MCFDKGLKLYSPPYSSYYYIGIDMTDMNDNETLKEFKESVNKKLESLGFDVSNVCIVEGGWYDG